MLKMGWRHEDHYISHCSGLVHAANTRVSQTGQLIRNRNPLPQSWRWGIQRAACQHLDAVSHGREKRGWVTSSKLVQGCLSLLTEDRLPCPKELFMVPLLISMLELWNLEGTFLNYNSHYWLSRTDPVNSQLLHDAISVLTLNWYELMICL